MSVKYCHICGEELKTPKGNQKYCSDDCREIVKKRQYIAKVKAKKHKHKGPKLSLADALKICEEHHLSYGKAQELGLFGKEE